ncbi:unnamed protein product [Rotaria magnacalcarata]
MSSEDLNQRIAKYLDDHQKDYIQRLSDAVSIPSVSAWPEHRPEVVRMVEWTKSFMETLGVTVELADVGEQKLSDGTKLKLPNVILGTYGNDKAKKTVMIYGHLDVQPAQLSDGWDSEPFVLTERDGKLYGRGSTDDKGPVISWLNVIEAYQKLNEPFPVNVKFVLESMEEYGSDGLEDLLKSLKNTFLSGVDYVVISDSYWLGKTKPCLQYGLRGICYFFLDVECSTKDLHSGCFGGTIHEAMTDLIALMGTLVDNKGHILIDTLYDEVAPLTLEEEELYKPITFDTAAYCSEAGVQSTIQSEKDQILMHRWRYPSLSLHGIQGAFDGCGCKTVIPRHVIGKFSIRIVPNMKISTVEKLVENHVQKIMKERNSPNKVSVKLEHGGDYWIADPNNPQYLAARKATVAVHGIEPDLTREGGSIPITLTFQEQTGKNVLLLPIGASDDGAHSQNEKFDISNYMNGMKLIVFGFDQSNFVQRFIIITTMPIAWNQLENDQSQDSNATASSPSLWKNSQNKTCPSSYFNSRPTSNVAGTLDCKNLSLINPSYTKQPEVPECECPPTPCMIRYRQSSVPAVITTRIIKRPQSFDHSLTKVDMETRSSNLI